MKMNHGSGRALGLAALIVSVAACGGAGSQSPDEGSATTLTQGARGAEVRAAYEYLRKFGYFPNAEFERHNPQFRPMAPAPADPEVFDENLAVGLRKFQKNAGIEVTGVLDAATQALIGQPRCGVLDEDPDADRESKWAFFQGPSTSNRWNTIQTEITYRISTAGCGADCLPKSTLDTAEARALINSAINSWEFYTTADFTEVTAGGDIIISYVSDADTGLLGRAAPPGPQIPGFLQGPVIHINKNYPSFNSTSFKDMIVHEFGHVMGLRHTPEKSGAFYARMYPFAGHTFLHLPGDAMGASVALGAFSNYQGIEDVVDVDANCANNSYRVWALASDGTPMQYSGGSWVARSGITGSSIAVCADNTAWVVKANGSIASWNPSTSSWTARALPAGGGTARAVGCIQGDVVDPIVIYVAMSTGTIHSRKVDTGWTSLGAPGGTVNEVDVAMNGVVYALKANGELWQRKGGAWSRHSIKLFNDIGVGGDDYLTTLWAIDTNQLGWAWAEQGALPAPSTEGAIARWEPINEPGPMKRIAASRDHAFAIWADSNLDGTLWRRTFN